MLRNCGGHPTPPMEKADYRTRHLANLHRTWAGLWDLFIGWFIRSTPAPAGYSELLVGHTVREVMMADRPPLLPRLTLDVVVDHLRPRPALFPGRGARATPRSAHPAPHQRSAPRPLDDHTGGGRDDSRPG
jgi:hypothetical protein